MKFYPYAALGCIVMVCGSGATGVAQERAAGGAVETQMTWSALSGQVADVNAKMAAVTTLMTQMEACGKKGMLYGPGVAGADATGCVVVSVGHWYQAHGDDPMQGNLLNATKSQQIPPCDPALKEGQVCGIKVPYCKANNRLYKCD